MASVSLFILYSSALSVTYPPFGIRAKLAGNSYCKLHFISIKLAGSTAMVINYFEHYHYFDHVISCKFYFVLHLFSDNSSITIHRLLHLLSLLCDLSFGRLSLLSNLFVYLSVLFV